MRRKNKEEKKKKIMQLIADLHLHSKYSRAVSPKMVVPEIARWARKKGIDLVGAPDWTHPLFFRELKETLMEVGEGLYQVKSRAAGIAFGDARQKSEVQSDNSNSEGNEAYFILSTEISSIYSQGNKTYRIHNLVIAPSFGVAEKINQDLRNKGVNLLSDGRPITGLSSIELCDLVFSASRDCLVIPCHIWTPWFSLYGSRSGFDSLKDCFGEFSDRIYAVETGLSSDPAMNWRIGELDNRNIVSFSDAHSSVKLGREATVFEVEDIKKLRYEDIREAIMGCHIAYTIEFNPEEGKYHYTGHRKCGVKQTPEETKKLGETCPVCGRELTVGVMHRVEELATRSVDEVKTKEVIIGEGVKGIGWQSRPPYVMLVPLMEILSESLGSGVSSQIVETEYNRLTTIFTSEFQVLLKTPIAEIAKISSEKVTDGILRIRLNQVFIDPGYDGVFGAVKIWPDSAKVSDEQKQMSLF